MESAIELRRIGGTNVMALQGDLTMQPVQAIVNAANENLQHGGGVAEAIVRAGGRVIQEESDAWVRANGPLGPGEAAVTTAGVLVASHVIHVVGPRYRPGQENAGMLRDATLAALDAATENDLESVALPAISAGIFGYPTDEATSVIVGATAEWLRKEPRRLVEVRLVGFSAEVAGLFAEALTEAAAA